MKKIILFLKLTCYLSLSYGQFSVGSDGISVKANEVVHFDGLTLTPSSDLTLTSTTLTRTDANTITPSPINSYIHRYFSFSNTIPAFSGTIRFSYAGANLGGLTAGSLQLNIRTSSAWTGGFGTDVGTGGGSYVEATSLSSTELNTLTLASSSSALPVTWLSFNAEKQGAASLLRWVTANEQNTKDFEVQHSINGISWKPIGIIPAAGNSTTLQEYQFVHPNPTKGNVSNYYRIKQNDLDGKFSYSKVVVLKYADQIQDITAFPNPAKDVLIITAFEAQEIRLINMNGHVIWKGNVAVGRSELSVTGYPRGTYVLQTKTGSQKIILQ